MLGHVLHQYLESTKLYKLDNLSYRNKLNNKTIIVDVTNQKKTKEILEKVNPSVVINCIGVLINGSIENPKNAIYLNAYFPHWLKEICENLNSKLIHISTDCVFSGLNGSYDEDSIKDSNDIYGKTKSLGEFNSNDHLCIRTSIIGPELKGKGEGLIHWLFNQNGKIYGYKNVYWSGVTTLELSKAINFSIKNNIDGLWNLTNGEAISKYSLIEKIIKEFSKKNIELLTDKNKRSNKSLISKREINYMVPNYDMMLKDLFVFYSNNKSLYNYQL